jgi:hypothetical protein
MGGVATTDEACYEIINRINPENYYFCSVQIMFLKPQVTLQNTVNEVKHITLTLSVIL